MQAKKTTIYKLLLKTTQVQSLNKYYYMVDEMPYTLQTIILMAKNLSQF